MSTRIDSERVKLLRLSKAWTQQNLADNAVISLRSVQRIEREGLASLQSRAAIAHAFGIDPIELEISSADHSYPIEQLLFLSLFVFSSFYFGLLAIEPVLARVPLWMVPLIPSLTFLIFGSILQFTDSPRQKLFLEILGCVFLAMLLTPPNAVMQLKLAAMMFVTYKILELCTSFAVRSITQKRVSLN
ncbi:MAG: hypothetical protein GKR91_17615 [Pseudomonadales bacterium]|nr:hypothetical protein [Pseudomonadales bacterium]